jgi:glutamate synthase domain-containing protein 2
MRSGATIPVIGRFRGLFSTLGEFFRQYFFAMDREELPFNRAQREWVKHAVRGRVKHAALRVDAQHLGRGYADFHARALPAARRPVRVVRADGDRALCAHPYNARSFFNISGMSYGAISKPAVRALSRGARMAGCWMNTGEGALSPYHLEGEADIVFQIGTAKFGVRDADGNLDDDRLRAVAAHTQVKMFEIKLAQGAKPGKGGILPARQDHR